MMQELDTKLRTLELTNVQKDLHTTFENHNHVLVRSARNVGVTTAMIRYAFEKASSGWNVMYLVPTKRLANALSEHFEFSTKDDFVYIDDGSIHLSHVYVRGGEKYDLIIVDSASYISSVMLERLVASHTGPLILQSGHDDSQDVLFNHLWDHSNTFHKVIL